MFQRTSTLIAPWTVVRADDKHLARLNLIRDLLSRLDYSHRSERLIIPDPKILFGLDESHLKNCMINP
jgi:polyphosphate kinase